ncbi:unnamed protein product [Hermetia illucens]|uniref:Enkurin domain-containing protein n=1 Tax=Hermetia illucens TaxID=343691 RepID=A0A7R8UHL3_HERIL|nr:enkurin [Hermetia illucens]CAD7080779.1 unnamed protein product [Hermetia illucens]
MAMVYLKEHNENIYNAERIINEPQYQHSLPNQQSQKSSKKGYQKVLPPDVYVSKFRAMVESEAKARKAGHRTMGYANTPLSPPDKFLKKNQGIRWKSSTDHKCIKKNIPPVPRHDEVPAKPPAPTKSKDSEQKSKETIKSIPKRPPPRYVDTRHGTVHDLYSSGLMPHYVFRPAYGKIPDYMSPGKIQQRYKEGFKESNQKRNGGNSFGQQNQGENGARYISQEERCSLLTGLKQNWQKLQQRYQGLSVLTDTEPKKQVKMNLERELKQLEQDIMLLENNPHIYVCDNANQ